MATNNSGAAGKGRSSSGASFLGHIKGKRVNVKLNDGTVYAGALICIDGNLNVVLENVTLFDSIEEAQNLQASKEVNGDNEKFSEVFIRGNNVCYIAPTSTVQGSDGSSSDSSSSSSRKSGSNEDSSSSVPSHQAMIQTVGQ